MKTKLLISALILCIISANGQSKNYKYGVTAGGYIQQYNGNLGNSFFKFNTVCFAGVSANFGLYLNKSFDLNLGGSMGQFGYCQTEADANRVVSLKQRCPGCTNRLGMGELRAFMVSGNIALKYKFANNIFLKENSKLAPYIYLGMGINSLTDNMGRHCVNEGNHLSINAGLGIKYNITERLNIGYNIGLGCFMTKKVYYTNALASEDTDQDAEGIKMAKRKDMYMQNTLFLGFNF